jgi:DMSO/TMAO reductase YedYZ molybdopterin-dependent catalytic subunit
MAVGHLLAALVNPPSSPVLAMGAAVVDATPTPVKEWAVRTFGTADKPVLLLMVILVTVIGAVVCGLLARRRRTVALFAVVALGLVAAIVASMRPASGSFDALPGLAAGFTGALVLNGLLSLLVGRAGPAELRESAAEAPDPVAEGPHPVAEGGAEAVEGSGGPVQPSAGFVQPSEGAVQPSDGAVMPSEGAVMRSDGAGELSPGAGQPAYPKSMAPTRRRFVIAAAGVAALSAVAAAVGHRIGRVPTLPAALRLPAPAEPARPLPAGIERAVRGVSPFQTPTADFYRVDTALIVPRVDAETWKLTIDGAVDHPLTLTYADLLAMPMIERDVTLTCVSNEVGGPYVGGARWVGVRTADLFERAGVRASADQILSTSTDGFTVSTPVQALTDGRDAMLAVAMNGAPLPAEHGFPVRMVTPGLYGFVGCTKWVTSMTATTYAARPAYWTQRGWAAQAPIHTESRIDVPSGGSTIEAGKTYIGGVAWAQGRGITRVEVQVDEGDWLAATLGPDAGIDYWRQWYLPWTATTGRHTLTVRATDARGQQQAREEADPFPSGATGWHRVDVSVH